MPPQLPPPPHLLWRPEFGPTAPAGTLHWSQEEKIQHFPANKSSRNLQDDLNDFLALIPLDEIVNIVLNYVANGGEVQAALQYLVSEEFESTVVFGDQQPELYDVSITPFDTSESYELLNFLKDSGLDPYGFINMVHDFLSIPQIRNPPAE
ncbi:uncharacterized protein LOC124613861 [Schistocerca americana]|uniref:uncharacterized protein LOC124613861 n=1 Tax=Schistocerca americana TaxID=7009 RepID=UPI001F4FC2BE|nr:uncharacterized protein LOC124613861 [Schistocerca americana]